MAMLQKLSRPNIFHDFSMTFQVFFTGGGYTVQLTNSSQSYLPVAEVQLWTSKAARSFAYLVSKAEAFNNRQNCRHVEYWRTFP